MNGFQKRVALLEKWVPSLLPQLKNIDDMAEIILDVWDEAAAHTEQRIIKLLENRRDWLEDMVNRGQIPMIGPVEAYSNAIALTKRETNE